jgi:hypothetical protein
VPAHQALATQEPNDEDNPIVQEEEPELEVLAETVEPEPVTEDAAEFGNPEPEITPASPGDAPVPGEDETPETGPPRQWVHDDPLGGVPIEPTAGAAGPEEDGDTAVEQVAAAETREEGSDANA